MIAASETRLIVALVIAVLASVGFWMLAKLGAARQQRHGYACEIGTFPFRLVAIAVVGVGICALRLPLPESELYAVLIPALAISAATDSRALALFEFVNYPLIGLLAVFSVALHFVLPSLGGMIVGLILLGLAYATGRLTQKRDGVGLGDLPLVAAVGVATGPFGVALIVSCGAVFALIARRGNESPMAPGLFVAALGFALVNVALTSSLGYDLMSVTSVPL